MTFGIAHASARPKGWYDTFYSAVYGAAIRTPEYVLSVDTRFGEFNTRTGREELPVVLELSHRERKCSVDNWINAINRTTADVVLVNSDDFKFPLGWDTSLLKAIGERDPLKEPFVVHVSTGSPRDHELMTFQIFSRALIAHWGYAMWPEYESLYVDDDFTHHAYADPKVEVVQARDITFEHMHPSFGKGEIDAVYAHENRLKSAQLGSQIFNRRKACNFSECVACMGTGEDRNGGSGLCHCGDSMDHSAWDAGHSPVEMPERCEQCGGEGRRKTQ